MCNHLPTLSKQCYSWAACQSASQDWGLGGFIQRPNICFSIHSSLSASYPDISITSSSRRFCCDQALYRHHAAPLWYPMVSSIDKQVLTDVPLYIDILYIVLQNLHVFNPLVHLFLLIDQTFYTTLYCANFLFLDVLLYITWRNLSSGGEDLDIAILSYVLGGYTVV